MLWQHPVWVSLGLILQHPRCWLPLLQSMWVLFPQLLRLHPLLQKLKLKQQSRRILCCSWTLPCHHHQ